MSLAAVPALVRGVRAYFDAHGVTARVSMGWNARDSQLNQGPGGANRVVFIPGEFDPTAGAPKILRAGTIDRMGAQNHVVLNPRLRALGWWHLPITCSVWAADASKPQDAESQIEVTGTLQQQTVAAIHNAVDPQTGALVGFASVEEWGPVAFMLPPVEMGFGREVVFSFVLGSPQFDAPVAMAFPSAHVERGSTS